MKVFTKIEEYLSAQPQTVPDPKTKPSPVKRPSPSPSPSRPSPIRRDKPSVDPMPKAKASDVVDRFLRELRMADESIRFDISKLKQRYEA